ncbi:MAG: hypothetical protein NC898_00530 [Candidatus Omnitrophica bacterium]|nr:hypothetical protein [Candidatus Omnitrophota bacterium]
MGKILFIFVITGMVLGEGLSWARENYNVLPSEPQYIVPSRERMREIPENKETEKIEKERRNPNKEAERFAKLIERIFSEITPEELEKIKLNKENFLLTYLKNKARLIDFSEKPLEEEEIFKIFQENLILWNAELLRLYYEVNKIKIKESFGDFLEHLHKKEVISAEVAFFAGLAGKENKEFIGKFFQMLPEGEKITLKPEIKEKNPEKINFLLKEALAENILKKTSRDLSREKTPVKKLFLKIELGKGMKFLGLLVSTLGTVLVSPQGMFFERNFPQGIEFNLAEFLKMVIKAFSLVMPYITIPHQQLPPPISDGYWQYLLVILSFWIFLKRAERFNWGLVYLHIQEPLKDFLA